MWGSGYGGYGIPPPFVVSLYLLLFSSFRARISFTCGSILLPIFVLTDLTGLDFLLCFILSARPVAVTGSFLFPGDVTGES
jgi:hypothetical protein